MIEIYHGNGKGKTTAAVGLAVRAVGNGLPVIFAQFLKDGSSAEVRILKTLPGMHYLTADVFHGFAFKMSEEEKADQRESYLRMIDQVEDLTSELFPSDDGNRVRGLIVLDESLHAVRNGLLPEERLLSFLEQVPRSAEVVLTGWEPTEALREKADYITHFQKEKHPYDRGIPARRGVEF